MTAPAVFTSNLAEWQRDHEAAIDAALLECAKELQAEIQRRLRLGYTSGAFTSGHTADSVTITAPIWEGGARVVRVGTDSGIALSWEMGRLNLFTREYERVEHWKESALAMAPRIRGTFVRVYRARMARWQPSGRVA